MPQITKVHFHGDIFVEDRRGDFGYFSNFNIDVLP